MNKLDSDLGLIFAVVHRDVEVGDLGKGLAGEVSGQLGVVHERGQSLVGVCLVEIDLNIIMYYM